MSATPLEQLAQSYFDLRWHFDPVAASEAGLSEYDERLGAFGLEEVREHSSALKSIMHALEALDLADLEDEIDRTALLNEIRFSVHRFAAERPHVRNPGFWLTHLFEGLHQPLFFRDRSRPRRVRSAAARLAGVRGFLDAARETLEGCPRVLVDLALDVTDSGATLVTELARAFGPDGDDAFGDAARDARDAIDEFRRHVCDTLAARAPEEFAIGAEAFAFRLQFQHALQPGATELARYGTHLMGEVEQDLERMAKELAPGVSWPELMDRLRDEYPSADALLPSYEREMARAREFVEERDLVPLPTGKLEVIETPSFLRPLVPFAAYQAPGAFSAERTGWFYVSPPPDGDREAQHEALRDHCVHEIPSTAVHEAYPGHHLQFLNAHAQQRPVRRLLATPVTIEGWALYCEDLMVEQGFYQTVEERFFQRVALLWRALRIVLDVGLHAGGLAMADAVDMLVDRVHLARSHANAEVRRYCADPTYQLAYATGRRELRRLRDDYRARAGSGFTIRGFHEAVMGYGGLPVSLMRWGMGLDGQG